MMINILKTELEFDIDYFTALFSRPPYKDLYFFFSVCLYYRTKLHNFVHLIKPKSTIY